MDNEYLIKDIIINQKNFDNLPRNENGTCIYRGNLIITYSFLTKLPDNLTVIGTLNCSCNNITVLPKNINITNNLIINDNLLKILPNDLFIGGHLCCCQNKLNKIPKNLVINGSLYCSNNYLNELPDDLTIGGDLHCVNNKIKKEIKSYIKGKIYMDNNQKIFYNRCIKINKLKKIIYG